MDELTRAFYSQVSIGTSPYADRDDEYEEFYFLSDTTANNADDWDNLDIDIYDESKPF